MSDKYVVPDAMVNAAHSAATTGRLRGNLMIIETRAILEAAIAWLAENAPKPERSQCESMWRAVDNDGAEYCREWVRRMFEAPEAEVPDAVKDLLWARRRINPILDDVPDKLQEMHDKWVLEAYRRGKAGK